MLLALAAFAKSSERFHGWLLDHRIFGPRLHAWQQRRVIPRSAKYTAYVSMTASLAFLAFVAGVGVLGLVIAAGVCLIGIAFLSRCPSDDATDSSVLR